MVKSCDLSINVNNLILYFKKNPRYSKLTLLNSDSILDEKMDIKKG